MKINLTASQAKGILRPADAEMTMRMCAVHHASAYQIMCVLKHLCCLIISCNALLLYALDKISINNNLLQIIYI